MNKDEVLKEDNKLQDTEEKDTETVQEEETLENTETVQEEENLLEQQRIRRRKRRRRNRFLSIMTVVLLLLVILGLGAFGVKKIADARKQSEHQEDVEDKLEQLTGNETDVPVISEPDADVNIPEPDPFEEALRAEIDKLSVEDKVAGLFFVTPEAITGVGTAIRAGDGTKSALEKFPVGGIIYFKKNIQSEKQIKEMLTNTQSYLETRLFFGVNEEGGSVSSIATKLNVDKLETAKKLGESTDTQKTYESGKTIAGYLSDLGFNVDFAPVADVLTDTENKLLSDRSFGSDAQNVANHVSAMVKGLEENGISACVKGFPGIGSANLDPEDGLSITERTKDEMRSTEFLGFQAAISENADFIMVSNVTVPSMVEGGIYIPSSLSGEIVKNVLREELGYEGIIITAPLNEKAVTEYYTSADAAIMAVQAGADMILMPENFEEAYYALLAEVLDGNISEERIDESLLRIYKVKYADMEAEES